MPDPSDRPAVAAWRAAIHAAWGEEPDPDVTHRSAPVAGVPCLVAGPGDAPVLVHVHGGGHVLGSPATAIPITARLAAALRVVSVGYRLAPEHPFPAALDDVVAVCADVGRQGTYALSGDSAGGGIALAAAAALRDRGAPVPGALVLFSPLVALDAVVGEAEARRHRDAYLGGLAASDPRVSPLRGRLEGLPPLLIQVAEDEPLREQAVALTRLCRALGVDATLDVWSGLWHAWHYHRIPEADLALSEASAFVRRHLRTTSTAAIAPTGPNDTRSHP